MMLNTQDSQSPLPHQGFSAFKKLSLLLEAPLKEIDHIIDDHLKSQIPLIDKISKHIIYAGGKRIRPCLSLACSHLFQSTQTPESSSLATAVEFIHTATLLHDDVIDESELRRGEPSAHQLWGNASSILVGDFLFARAFQLMVKTHNLNILNILSQTSAIIAEGEVLQLVESHNLNMTEETALKILGAKTAHLFGAACQTGALVAGATEEQAQHLFNYGYNLGLIFQITDDILDYTCENTVRGKELGDDFREGKITLPVIYAYEKATNEEQNFFEKTFVHLEQNQNDFYNIRNLLHQHAAIERSLKKAKDFSICALDSLNSLEGTLQNDILILLKEIVMDCLHRSS